MKTTAPIIQQQELTTRCNNACGFCYNPERCITAFTPRHEERADNLLVAELSVAKGVMAACPTGGEPLLVGDHLFEVLDIYGQAGCYTSINTNGRLVDARIVRQLKEAGLRSALVSMHGIGDLHNAMVGDDHAFEETWRGILTLREAGIPVMPNFVATAKNIHGLVKTGERLAQAGFGAITVTPFLPSFGSVTHDQYILQKDHYRKYFTTVNRIRAMGLKIDSTLPIPPCVLVKLFPDEWKDFIGAHSPRVCMAGRSFGVVSPDGHFRSCIQAPYLPEFGGDMRANYEKSWSRAGNWAETNLLPSECLECQALDVCGGGCRTSCMWENEGRVAGKTMYMGEPMTAAEAEPFLNRAKVETEADPGSTYRWRAGIKTRNEGWGTIIFNPQNQSFTILGGDIRIADKQAMRFASAKTARALSVFGAIRPTNEPADYEDASLVLPGNTLLPRLAGKLTNEQSVYCLRADTGERYYF